MKFLVKQEQRERVFMEVKARQEKRKRNKKQAESCGKKPVPRCSCRQLRGGSKSGFRGLPRCEGEDVIVLSQVSDEGVRCSIWMCVNIVVSKSGGSLPVCRSCHVFSRALVWLSSCLSDVCLLADVACGFVNNVLPLADSRGRACFFFCCK